MHKKFITSFLFSLNQIVLHSKKVAIKKRSFCILLYSANSTFHSVFYSLNDVINVFFVTLYYIAFDYELVQWFWVELDAVLFKSWRVFGVGRIFKGLRCWIERQIKKYTSWHKTINIDWFIDIFLTKYLLIFSFFKCFVKVLSFFLFCSSFSF